MSKIVYILEDEYSLRSTLRDYLEQNDYEVHAYSDPSFCPLTETAACKCNKQTPCADFIITDINMPGMTGLKFIELQKEKDCKVSHMAIMSATWSESEYNKAEELGCKVFEKPFGLNDLLQWMKSCEEIAFIPINKIGSCNRFKISK
jgi:DNA-binding response OmpR family regulator